MKRLEWTANWPGEKLHLFWVDVEEEDDLCTEGVSLCRQARQEEDKPLIRLEGTFGVGVSVESVCPKCKVCLQKEKALQNGK